MMMAMKKRRIDESGGYGNGNGNGDGENGNENESEPTSRLIIQNLPRSCDESRLRDVFSETGGIITDVRVCRMQQNDTTTTTSSRNKNSLKDFGSSRRFGFIGFKSVEDALAAYKYFDNTFIDSSRITVNFAQRVKSAALPRPWSKYTEGSSKHAKVLFLHFIANT